MLPDRTTIESPPAIPERPGITTRNQPELADREVARRCLFFLTSANQIDVRQIINRSPPWRSRKKCLILREFLWRGSGSGSMQRPPYRLVPMGACARSDLNRPEETTSLFCTRSQGRTLYVPRFPRSTTAETTAPRAKKKPSPRRVAQEGFMAESVYRRGQTDVKASPRFRRQRDRVDATLNAMSSPSRVFRRRGACLAIRVDPASGEPGHGLPIGATVRGTDLMVVAPCRQPGRRRAGRPDIVVADDSDGAIAPLTPADRSIGNQSRLIPAIPPCERLRKNYFNS